MVVEGRRGTNACVRSFVVALPAALKRLASAQRSAISSPCDPEPSLSLPAVASARSWSFDTLLVLRWREDGTQSPPQRQRREDEGQRRRKNKSHSRPAVTSHAVPADP